MSLADIENLAQRQRDDLNGTRMGRGVITVVSGRGKYNLSPERDAIIHAKLQHLAVEGWYPSDAQMEGILRERRGGVSNV